ncbi:MAG TPA: ATP-dependent sacrificial sulfur transferase LarE [Candidatus Krumholzibacteria bacterium]|nr:ATP-dependent sacrificial sulfur transferase LarE [Candidatus Krumholzibacteria bacterium]
MNTSELKLALDRLEACIRAHGPMVVACSGGVDSALLAVVAHRVLEGDMMCVIGVSASLAGAEHRDAVAFFEQHDLAYVEMPTYEMNDARYRANNPDRCFFCKHELFERMESLPQARAFPVIAYGANADDRFDHRPGARAADAHRVCAPLAEAGFTKALVRAAARALGLSQWDKPASPCLASRVPYQSEVTPEKLRQIEAAEAALKRLGFEVCRVRHYGAVARIEVPVEAMEKIKNVWGAVEREVRSAGFDTVEIDERGFKSGRMNEALPRQS